MYVSTCFNHCMVIFRSFKYIPIQVMQVKHNTLGLSFNQCCSGNAIHVTYCQCVSLTLVIQHTMRVGLNCHLWPVWLYHIFPRQFISDTIFGITLLNIRHVFWLSPHLSETFLILRRTGRDMINKEYRSSCKMPVIHVIF